MKDHYSQGVASNLLKMACGILNQNRWKPKKKSIIFGRTSASNRAFNYSTT